MAANLTVHLPITQVQTKSDTTPWTMAKPEAAGQTFTWGTPVQLNASGYVQAWDGTTVAAGILGIAESFGANLGSAGAGAPVPPFGQITGNIATSTYGTVPGQVGGVNIAFGTPSTDGRTLYMAPGSGTVFEGVLDNSAGAVAADWTPALADVGKNYGLSKDSAGPYWYVDKGKTGAAAVLQVIAVGQDGYVLNGRVRFQFLAAAAQII